MRWLIGGFVTVNLLVLVLQLLLRPDVDAVASSRPSSTPALDASVPKIKLLSELDSSTLSALRVSAATQSDSAGSPENSLCTLIGPFSKLLRAEYFMERLTALELKADVRELEVPGEPSYWVYLPSLGSRKEAFGLLRELQAKSVDSYVIPGGELENGISFGMFSQKKLAEQRLAAMRKDGYQAELKEVMRSYQEVWVVLEPGQAGQLSPETWQAMLLEEDDEIDRRQNYCPPVASN
jgi:hypothetical protein